MADGSSPSCFPFLSTAAFFSHAWSSGTTLPVMTDVVWSISLDLSLPPIIKKKRKAPSAPPRRALLPFIFKGGVFLRAVERNRWLMEKAREWMAVGLPSTVEPSKDGEHWFWHPFCHCLMGFFGCWPPCPSVAGGGSGPTADRDDRKEEGGRSPAGHWIGIWRKGTGSWHPLPRWGWNPLMRLGFGFDPKSKLDLLYLVL